MDSKKVDPGSEPQRRIASCATTPEVAEIVVASFEEIELTLSPIIGSRGVVALYNRSVHLTAARHAWLHCDTDSSLASLDFGTLRDAFLDRDVAEAAAGGTDLLLTFRTVLSTLIGASLTEKLLHSSWTRFAHETDVKKASS